MIEDENNTIDIEEDYTKLEGAAILINDDSDIQNDTLYNEAIEYKSKIDETREALKSKLLSILEKGEINSEDSSEISLLQDQYTENYTALQTLASENNIKADNTDSNSSEVIINSEIDYDKLMDIIAEKADWLYIDEDGQIMLNGEVVPKIKVIELEAEKIKADVGEFKDLTTENFEAINAKIDNLEVGDLTAINADIQNLKATVAEINTLIGGNLTMDNIQSLVLTADKVTIADALIKSAMIESVSANKITSGSINTNLVNIQSEDGSMVLNGSLQQFKDDAGNVRIQIGKDTTGDFTFALYGADGKGQLINQDGITASAISDGLIVNDMVADDANISGGKLDIDSVFTEMNNSTSTLKSTKIYLDDKAQTLDVAFNQLSTTVENINTATGDIGGLREQVITNTTNIGLANGRIDTLISNTTITKEDGTTTQLKDAYMSTEQTVEGLSTKVGSLETNYKSTLKSSSVQYYLSTSTSELSGGSWSDTAPEWANGKYMWQRMKYTYTDGSVTYGTESCVAGATGEKGEQGIPGEKGDTGDKGDKGQSLTKSTPQWYLSTSNTTQEGGGWSETMPPFETGKYLWLRYKMDWENPTATTYSTPTLEQVGEAVKEVVSKQATLEQNLDGFKTEVSKTYYTNANAEILESNISTVSQTADKINWIVAGGNGASNMTLTDDFYNVVSNNITLTADHINLNGYVSNDDSNWSITTEGNMEAKNLSVEGELSTDILNANVINNPRYPATLDGDINIYINNTTGSDDYSLDEVLESYDEAEAQNSADLIKKFASLKGVADALPLNLNGKTVRIYCETDDPGQVLFSNFNSGCILIFLCSHEVKGYIGDYNCYCDFKIYGGSDQNKPTTYGVIRPSVNTVYTRSNSSVFFQKSPVCGAYYCNIYGASSDSGYSAIKVEEDCVCRVDNCNFYSAYIFVNASSIAQVYCATTTGLATGYGFAAYSGSTIHLANTSQANGKKGNAYWSNASVIFGSLRQTIDGKHNITWDSSTDVIENTTTTEKTTTATVTYKSNYGDTYRSTVYNNWKKDGTCRQGDYGYGDCTGCWFFGTQFADLKGKTINKVTIKITRQSGGSSASVEHKLWMHNHSTRPSGAPTLKSGWSTTFTLTRGQTKTITITDSAVLDAIKAGTCKGFAIRHTYDSSHYSVCSGSATVKITYTE